ncbi:M28 family peptidase [Planococcus halocryophilus]|uniref:M28 family peptidase n=1 Tax=Planococcus halocryophilus TaxID=1215089 RepID=UPI001F105877|nr:M28 family peptidase [Planococcus halocryophilus]MCH4826298.1 M28 family peptidase [Planococcus halocryophilus]
MITDFNEIQKNLLDAVSADQLMAHTAEISKEIRLSGSAEELRAFEYAKNVLDNFGAETKLTFQDGFISLPVSAELKVGSTSLPCITHSMSVTTGTQGLQGDLVYIKSLRSTLEAAGKIVLTDGIATPGAVEILEKAGSLAAIFINGSITHEMTVSRVWGNPTPETKKEFPKIPVLSITENEGSILLDQLEHSMEPVKVWLKTIVDTGWRKIPTLIADFKGITEPEKFILFSGHIDSWHYGAMDNGSANATMLEVARVLSEYEIPLRRTLRLAFWSGHSHGRYSGSTYYNDMHWEDLHENCLLHVYADSLGGKGAVILGESNCMVETKDYGGSFVKALTGEDFIGKRFGRGGDQSFWGTGVPALFMGMSEQPLSDDVASETLVRLFGGIKSGGFGWWWHTTEDTLDKLDPINLRRDCQIYVSVIHDACTRKVLPLNHAAGAREIGEALENYQIIAGDRLDLTLAIERAALLEGLGVRLNATIRNKNWSDSSAKIFNDSMLAISHELIPLNYVSGDKFDQDLAMNQPILPLLKDVSLLALTEKGSGQELEWQTFLKRRLNKVEYSLLKACRIAQGLI